MTTLDAGTTRDLSVDDLRGAVRGSVIAPGDAEYDDARTVFNAAIDRRPAVIVRVAGSDDVRTVVALARETGLQLAIRSGGHGAAGDGVVDDGIVLDLSGMKGVELDVAGRTVWAETGLTAAELTSALGEHGLVLGFGDTGSVGIGGITLGGGVGYLVRKFGLTIDDLLAAEIVTADGELHTVDGGTEPDLFWAIRGGGGNFGVVTRFKFRVHELSSIVGGMLLLPANPESVQGFIAAATAAPDELSTIANVMPCPPMPFVPEEHHGKLAIMAIVAYAGDPDAGERAMAPLRALGTPLADMVRTMPYFEIYSPEDPDYRPTAAAKTLFMDRVDRDDAELIVERLLASDAALRAVQLRVLGGAMARIADDATAFAHRQSRIMVNVAAFYQGEDDRKVREAWVDALAADLVQDDRGAYVNFVADEGDARIHDAYPGGTWDRLAAIKRRYDPANLFHLNRNIPPATSDTGSGSSSPAAR